MKKLLVLGLAVVLVVAFTVPASAFESVFGGYWRTRAIAQGKFTGEDGGNNWVANPFFGDADDPIGTRRIKVPQNDLSRVDTRTRLYYTAIINDNLKFVNRFEFDATWGSPGYGDFGTDGKDFEIKHSFADFNVGALRFTVGAQGHAIARGFVFDDDYAGVTASYKWGDHLIPFTWAKINEGGLDANSDDADMFALWPVFQLGESWSLNPFAVMVYSKEGDGDMDNPVAGPNWLSEVGLALTDVWDDGINLYWLGLSVDGSIGGFNLWGTGIYQAGKVDSNEARDVDVKAYMFAAGASVPLGPANIRGQGFYASGQSSYDDDDDIEEFFGTNGQSYYWAEIMGYGTFDNQVSAGSPGNKIGNIAALNIGATIKPLEKLSLSGDVWYATLVEDGILSDEKELGVELDLKATYMLIEGLNLDIIGAYLFADDATSLDGNNKEDPWEVGTRLSLSF
jgi:hypothetical protein